MDLSAVRREELMALIPVGCPVPFIQPGLIPKQPDVSVDFCWRREWVMNQHDDQDRTLNFCPIQILA
jgi:hypothetical protein